MTLRKGKHVVSVRTAVETVDDRGAIVQTWGRPVEYSVNVQPLSSSEVEAFGLKVSTAYRVKYWPQEHGGKQWVGGAYSRISWDRREYDQQGEAMLSSMSPRTGHVTVIMTARTSGVR